MGDTHSDALVFFGATGDLAYKKTFPRCRRWPSAATSTCRSSAWPRPARGLPRPGDLRGGFHARRDGRRRGRADTSACRAPGSLRAIPDLVTLQPGDANEVVEAYRYISEIELAVEAHERLLVEGVHSRVVSMPSWDIFEHQPQEYRDRVLPPEVTARVAIEQASAFGWERYVGQTGRVIGMQTFGASAPLKALQKEYGFTVDNVVGAARAQLTQVLQS